MYVDRLIKVFVITLLSVICVGCKTSAASEKALFVRRVEIFDINHINPEIFSLDLNSSRTVKISDGNNPTISPDGKYIAFTRMGSPDAQYNNDIWVANAEGRWEKNITRSDLYKEFAPVWSLDGKTLAYQKGESSRKIDVCFIKPDGTDNWCLKQVDWLFTVNCSPYGEEPTSSCVSPEWKLSIHDLVWIPTQNSHTQKILLSSDEGNNIMKIYLVTLYDGRLENISFLAEGDYYYPSSNGDSVLITKFMGTDIYKVNIDGSDLTKIASLSEGCYIESLVWSKNNDKVLFAQSCIGNKPWYHSINIMNADGTGLTTVLNNTSNEQDYSSVNWAPDGKSIVFSIFNYQPIRENYYNLNLADSAVTQLTEPKDNVSDYGLIFFP